MGIFVRYTNAHYLVVDTPREKGDGLFNRNKEGVPQSWDLEKETTVNATDAKIKPALLEATRLKMEHLLKQFLL